jgi:Na+/melibiose symporter-like transporter
LLTAGGFAGSRLRKRSIAAFLLPFMFDFQGISGIVMGVLFLSRNIFRW